MSTAEVVDTSAGQIVKLPTDFPVDAGIVSVRREGDAVVLEPLKPATWPEGFFEAIRIDDPEFVRPDQGVSEKSGECAVDRAHMPTWAERTAGLLRWTGNSEDLRRIAEGDEFGIEE